MCISYKQNKTHCIKSPMIIKITILQLTRFRSPKDKTKKLCDITKINSAQKMLQENLMKLITISSCIECQNQCSLGGSGMGPTAPSPRLKCMQRILCNRHKNTQTPLQMSRYSLLFPAREIMRKGLF